MKVKICGIMDIEAALTAVEAGVDALGFVFAESKRRITPEKAKNIISQLPDRILKVGVFVNEEQESIERIITETGINLVQLHGDEPPSFCQTFSVPVVKAYSIHSPKDLVEVANFSCEYALFDSPKERYHGGNGKVFNWELIKDFQTNGKKIILAGGLHEGNVVEAIRQVQPFMVDVSSGVETNGKKDLEKIKAFIAKAKSASREEVR